MASSSDDPCAAVGRDATVQSRVEPEACRPPVRTIVALIGLLALTVALRVPGLFTDFWFDEIWGYFLARQSNSPLDVLTAVHHTANHWLSVLWLYALGPEQPFWLYRLPSLAAGIAAVAVAGALARALTPGASGSRARLFAMTLTATSFGLINYSTEARGYSLVVLSALCATYCLLLFELQQHRRHRAGYWLWMALGLMSHLMATLFLMSCIAYSLRVRGAQRRSLVQMAWTHAPPLAFLGLIVAVDVAHFQKIVPPLTEVPSVVADVASLCLGSPTHGVGALLGSLLAAGLLVMVTVQGIGGSGSESRARTAWWLLPAMNLAVLPCFLVLALRLPFFFARYCIVGVALFQVALALWLAALSRLGGWRAAMACAVLVAVTTANVWQWVRFQDEGRGHYRAAIEEILGGSGPGTVTVASDNDFQNLMVLNFYREYIPELQARLVYVKQAADEQERADWRIVHSQDATVEPEQQITLGDGARYVLHGVHASSWLSGMRWFVYRRDGA